MKKRRYSSMALGLALTVTLAEAASHASDEDALTPPQAVTDWLNEHAIVLRTVDAGNGFDDLEAVGALMGGSRLVGVGESTHGTSEFFRFKHRLFEYLVERLGFTAFVMEAGYVEGIAIDRYLQTGDGTAAAAARATRFWTWSTPEVAALLQWIRDYNADAAHTRKIRFYGNDMQFADSAGRHVLTYLEDIDPSAVPDARQALSPFAVYQDLLGYWQLPQAERDAHDAALQALVAHFDARRDDYIALSGEEAWAFARQAVVVTIQSKRFWEVFFPDDSNIRDAAMAENTLWALDREGANGRAMLWAHNGHVMAIPSGPVVTQGVHLRQSLGNDYFVVGQLFDRGRFTALEVLPDQGDSFRITALREFTVGSSSQGSLNDALASADPDVYIVDVRRASEDPASGAWWSLPQAERSIGALYAHSFDRIFYESLVVPHAYDLVLQVDVTTAAPQLPRIVSTSTQNATVSRRHGLGMRAIEP